MLQWQTAAQRQRKKVRVHLTLSEALVRRARAKRLPLSRVVEQAIESILYFLEQNEPCRYGQEVETS